MFIGFLACRYSALLKGAKEKFDERGGNASGLWGRCDGREDIWSLDSSLEEEKMEGVQGDTGRDSRGDACMGKSQKKTGVGKGGE